MGVLDFFGGFSQGFGQSFAQGQQEARRRQDRQNELQLEALHGLFNSAKEEGDNEKAASTLELMIPLTGGKVGDNKHPYSLMAKAIREATPKTDQVTSQQGLEAKQTEDQTIANPKPLLRGNPETGTVDSVNPLTELERPRRATETRTLQKGYFPTPEERQQRELRLEVDKQKALLPITLEKYKKEREVVGEEYRKNQELIFGKKGELEDRKSENRKEEDVVKAQAKLAATNKYSQILYTKTKGDPENATPEQMEEARVEAEDFYKSLLEKNQSVAEMNRARASEQLTRHGDRVASLAAKNREIDAKIANYGSLDTFRKALAANGARKNDISEASISSRYGEDRGKIERIRTLRRQAEDTLKNYRQQIAIANNSFEQNEDVKKRALDKADEFLQEHDKIVKESEDLSKQLINSPQKVLTKSSTPLTAPNKTLSPKHKKDDVVNINGKKIKITIVYPDGTFDGDEIP